MIMQPTPWAQTRHFEPSRAAGLARLAAFLPHAGRHYASWRNHDHGPDRRANVSGLSPYLRHRLLTESEVLAAVLARHSQTDAGMFIQEVFWRTYFKGHLETRPAIWRAYLDGLERERIAVDASSGRSLALQQALAGRTGIDCFDAWIEELATTGYLHNHARMWFASIWIFTLKLPWQLGADLFLRNLIDGDPASNTLSWRWVAGLHTRGKIYLATAQNIRACTDGRFDPKGLAQDAAPLEEADIAPLEAMTPGLQVLPRGRVGLLLSAEDLHAPSFLADNMAASFRVAAIAGANVTTGRPALSDASLPEQFRHAALDDALAHAASTCSVPASRLPALSLEAIAKWAAAERLEAVITPHVPVGPVADALGGLQGALLRDHGIMLVQARRPFDERAWPHATRGYFAMKTRIPELIACLARDPSIPATIDPSALA
jgi:deoxyribodipyrimidine photo-lyase